MIANQLPNLMRRRSMGADELPVDPVALREEVKSKYRDVASNPHGDHHFHTGRPLAKRLGYDMKTVDAMPDLTPVHRMMGVLARASRYRPCSSR